MKYFSSLPKRTFTTTIGEFTISDFFTRYEINYDLALTKDVELDSHSTLIELSQNIYQDNNSIWLILLANEFTDPFSLAATNTGLFKDENQAKISTALKIKAYVSGSPITVGTSSIIAPYVAASGSSWSYSSIGNFDLNGPFTLVERTDYYAGKSLLKEQKIQTFILAGTSSGTESLYALDNQSGGEYTDYGYELTTKDKIQATAEVVEISNQQLASSIEGISAAYETTFATPIPPSVSSGTNETITALQYVSSQNKNLKVFIPSQVSKILSNLITFS